MAEIKIEHSREHGTFAVGGYRGDGTRELLVKAGFVWSDTYGGYRIPRSRNKRADRSTIQTAERLLRQFEHTVTVLIDEDAARPLVDTDAGRGSDVVTRTAALVVSAERVDAAAATRYARGAQAFEAIATAQIPPAAACDSAAVDLRRREFAAKDEEAGLAMMRESEVLRRRALAAANWHRHQGSLPVVVRRIERLETDARRLARELTARSTRAVAEYSGRIARTSEQLEYWRAVLAEAEANGSKVWGPDDFEVGDYARIGEVWFEVQRANRKTLSVLPFHPDRGFIGALHVVSTATSIPGSAFETRPYETVSGRMSAAEFTALAAVPAY